MVKNRRFGAENIRGNFFSWFKFLQLGRLIPISPPNAYLSSVFSSGKILGSACSRGWWWWWPCPAWAGCGPPPPGHCEQDHAPSPPAAAAAVVVSERIKIIGCHSCHTSCRSSCCCLVWENDIVTIEWWYKDDMMIIWCLPTSCSLLSFSMVDIRMASSWISFSAFLSSRKSSWPWSVCSRSL